MHVLIGKVGRAYIPIGGLVRDAAQAKEVPMSVSTNELWKKSSGVGSAVFGDLTSGLCHLLF
jgi:hypothetical protein